MKMGEWKWFLIAGPLIIIAFIAGEWGLVRIKSIEHERQRLTLSRLKEWAIALSVDHETTGNIAQKALSKGKQWSNIAA